MNVDLRVAADAGRYADLRHVIATTPLCDTHEHLWSEAEWVSKPADILQDLFGNYVSADLVVAGAPEPARQALMDSANPDIAARFEAVRPAWEATRHTGYGEAVCIMAREIYGLEELTPTGLAQANSRLAALKKPGERLRLLRDVARLDHVQIDHFRWPCLPDASGPDFFFYDLSWAGFCSGRIDAEPLVRHTGIEVKDLATLQAAMERLFEKFAPVAIAIKSQHAYERTLLWEERSDADAARALAAVLRHADKAPLGDRLCLGDWCWARGVELGIRYDLPFKLHTGYYAGHSRMPVDRIKPGHLSGLLARYPDGRFVLMHIAYPYSDELLALAKHYPNVWVDLCWAWSINPCAAADFVRRFIHSVPASKLFAFGGDTFSPTASVAYAAQARRWLATALVREVVDGFLSEPEAIALARRFMRENPYACFDLEGRRRRIRAEMDEAGRSAG